MEKTFVAHTEQEQFFENGQLWLAQKKMMYCVFVCKIACLPCKVLK